MHEPLKAVKRRLCTRTRGPEQRINSGSWHVPGFVPWLCLAVFFAPHPVRAEPVRYAYDELGRLRSVTAASGESAQYVYDAVGNLRRIIRAAAGAPVILEFSPNGGAIGTPVRVLGANFDPTPANNSVAFNGQAAAIDAASPTEIMTSVPAGATTGRLSVRTPAGTALSADYFRVSRDLPALPPVITGFTPASGTPGTKVTLRGRSFDPAPGAASAFLNERVAKITFVSPNALIAEVPAQVGSGPWRVATLAGEAVSAGDFLIVPPGVPAADVLGLTHLQLGQRPKGVDIDEAGKAIAVTYPNEPGEGLSVQFFRLVTSPADQKLTYKLFSPTLAMVATGTLDFKHQSLHLPVRAEIGTFTIVLDAPPDTTATAVAQLIRNGDLVIDGPVVSSELDDGQSTRLSFAGLAGQNLGLGLFDGTAPVDVTLYLPDGKSWLSGSGSGRAELDLSKLPATGRYQAVFTPRNGVPATFQAVLTEDASGSLRLGEPTIIGTMRLGQNARLSFDGDAGQGYGLAWRDVNLAGTTGASFMLYRPGGALLTSGSFFNGQKGSLDLTLPDTGPYTVVIDPGLADTAQLEFWLSADQNFPPLSIDGALTTMATSLFGQNARSSFSGEAGQKLGLAWREVSLTGATSGSFTLYRPTGASLSSGSFSSNQKGALNLSLPESGSYRLLVNPGVAEAASVAFELSADVDAGTLALDGAATPVTTSLFGQNGRLRFDGTAGQSLVLSWSDVAVTGTSVVSFTVYRPTGQYLTSGSASSGTQGSRTLSLPDTGTYSIFVETGIADSATVTFSLRSQ